MADAMILEQAARYRNRAACSRLLFSHRFCGKPVPTFPRDALAAPGQRVVERRSSAKRAGVIKAIVAC
jgi:hypothetical protein